jgi:hypothetical protein
MRAGDTAGAAPLLKRVCSAASRSRRYSQARAIHTVAGRGRSSQRDRPGNAVGALVLEVAAVSRTKG